MSETMQSMRWATRAMALVAAIAVASVPALADEEASSADDPLTLEAAAVDASALDAQAGDTSPIGASYQGGSVVAAPTTPIDGGYGQVQVPTSQIGISSSSVSSSSLQATVAGGTVSLGQ